GFIKGPVCRGQVALNVIRDRFWVVFLTPGMEYADEGAQFLADNTPVLALPGEAGDDIGLFDWRTYDDFGKKYLKQKENFIGKSILKNRKLGLDFIWDGEKHNRNAALTIFRHQDSATVVSGFVGDTPLTGWIVDYPLLERIHYLLVAGFNVYGSGGHQLATRKYMDYLRIDAENNFLRFMPSNRRQALYDNWHKGLGAKIVSFTRPPLFSIGHETDVPYQTTDPKKEFFQLIRRNMGPAAGETDPIAGCPDASCEAVGIGPVRREANRLLRRLSTFKGKRLKALPEVSFLRVETGDPDNDLAYTLLLNKAYSNIVFMIADEYRREPENDTVTVIPGFVGSYPNFFFSIKINQLNDFIEHLKQADTDAGMEFFYGRYGIRRNNPAIWEHYDWFNRQYKISRGRFAGIFDMNRYQNL
ncbi:MAG: fatty acid cis/trans isomerase, partial [Gammaproteobacteria bacterium]